MKPRARVLARRGTGKAIATCKTRIARRESAEDALRTSSNEFELLSQHHQAQEMSVGESRKSARFGGAVFERDQVFARARRRVTPQARHIDTQPLLMRTSSAFRRRSRTSLHRMNLRPSVLDDLGVASALACCVASRRNVYAIDVCPPHPASDEDIPQRLATTIVPLRAGIAEQRGQARDGAPRDHCPDAGSGLRHLMVCDDGVGLPAADSAGSFDLGTACATSGERTQMTGGKLTWSAMRAAAREHGSTAAQRSRVPSAAQSRGACSLSSKVASRAV